jgi:hypothetical protein
MHGIFEPPLDLCTGDLEGVLVGDDDRGAFAEVVPESVGDGGERARSDVHGPGVGSVL